MLNTKWIIMPTQDGTTLPIKNPHAMGSAWFVDDIRFVENATRRSMRYVPSTSVVKRLPINSTSHCWRTGSRRPTRHRPSY